MLPFSLYSDKGSRFKIYFRPVIDDIDIALSGAKKRNHIMVRFSKRIKSERETPVSQSIGLNTFSHFTFMLE